MSYHQEVVNKAINSIASFIEVGRDNNPLYYLNIEGLTNGQIQNKIRAIPTEKVGLVSQIEVDDHIPCKLVTTYSSNEQVSCSIIYNNKEIDRVSYISNSIIDFLLMEEKKYKTIH